MWGLFAWVRAFSLQGSAAFQVVWLPNKKLHIFLLTIPVVDCSLVLHLQSTQWVLTPVYILSHPVAPRLVSNPKPEP